MAHRRLLIVFTAIIVMLIPLTALLGLMLRRGPTIVESCEASDIFFVVYLSIRPNNETFKYLAERLRSVIATESGGKADINFSLCVRGYQEVWEDLKAALANRTIFPVFGILSSNPHLKDVKTIKEHFEGVGRAYVVSERSALAIYAMLYAYGVPILTDPLAMIETLWGPSLNPNVTPTLGSLEARYRLFVYADMLCATSAKFFREAMDEVVGLTTNGTLLVALKNLPLRQEGLYVHRNLTALYLTTADSALVFEAVKAIYSKVSEGAQPSEAEVLGVLESLIGGPLEYPYRELVDRVITEDSEEAQALGIYRTPGLVVWDTKARRGLVTMGFRSPSDIMHLMGLLGSLGPSFT